MARIAGVDLPRDKQVHVGLTYIFGIGRPLAKQILAKSGVAPATRVKDLREDEIVKLREIIEREHKVEGDLRKDVSMNIKRLIEMGAREVLSAVFADKDIGRTKPIKADFVGVTVPNRYVFGFGMDAYGLWRNLPSIYALKE